MSLYQHSTPQSYGQSHPYPPQPPRNYFQHHPQPPMPTHPYAPPSLSLQAPDPSTFRRDYTARLSELTMNSRPIIQNLSMMAQNFTRYSDIVSECLQAHIRRVPPWMKLPAFYVLDAISKNVYDPYGAKFSSFVVPLFLETYGQVDPSTCSKMEEMLVTWRTGAPSGKELFGVAAQVALERQLWGNETPSVAESSTRHQGQAAPLTKSQVLAELDVTLALKEQAIKVNPYDSNATNHVNVLHQLRRMVEFGISQEELQQILFQLRAMGRETASAPPPPPQPVAPPPMYSRPPAVQTPVQYGQSSSSSAPVVGMYPGSVSMNQQPSTSASAAPIPSAAPNMSGITSLFDSLVKAGIVSSNSTPVGAGKNTHTPPPAPATPDVVKTGLVDSEKNERAAAKRNYAQKIFGMSIRFTTAEISRQKPQNVSLLYERLPIQCKQCALRFPDGPTGKKQMQDHLDLHFRQNRRAKESAGRGHSRSWFISINDWISEPSSDAKGKERESMPTGKNTTEAMAKESSKRDAELRASVVVVPPGDEAKSINCPVCKETLRSEFREDDEEWVWHNAVRVKDKIFHATCHAEMARSTTLASKLRADESAAVALGSRSGTPEYTAPATPTKSSGKKDEQMSILSPERALVAENSSIVGVKRKANGDEQDTGLDTITGTPPMKKIIMSTA